MPDSIKQELFKLSLSMPSWYGPDMELSVFERYRNFWRKVSRNQVSITSDILFGIPDTNSSLLTRSYDEDVKLFLANAFGIVSEKDMKYKMEEYLNGSRIKKLFDEKRNFYLSISDRERSLGADSTKYGENNRAVFSLISQYDKSLPPEGILAFDMANYTSICRLGAFLGYMGENDVIDSLNYSAELARKSYSSFEEFGLSSMVGILFCIRNVDNDTFNLYSERFNRMLTHPNSCWVNLDWNIL